MNYYSIIFHKDFGQVPLDQVTEKCFHRLETMETKTDEEIAHNVPILLHQCMVHP